MNSSHEKKDQFERLINSSKSFQKDLNKINSIIDDVELEELLEGMSYLVGIKENIEYLEKRVLELCEKKEE